MRSCYWEINPIRSDWASKRPCWTNFYFSQLFLSFNSVINELLLQLSCLVCFNKFWITKPHFKRNFYYECEVMLWLNSKSFLCYELIIFWFSCIAEIVRYIIFRENYIHITHGKIWASQNLELTDGKELQNGDHFEH